MTANELGKETIRLLAQKRLVLTPQNYEKHFCALADEKGFVVEDCQKVKRYIEKLSPLLQTEIAKYRPKTQDELLIYLVTTLNRLSQSGEGKFSLMLMTLIKRLLQSITLLHDKEARDLANASLERIERLADEKSMEIIKEKWFDFLTTYDDDILERLRLYGNFKNDDLHEIVDEMEQILASQDVASVLEPIASLIVASLTPSIASSMDEALADISYELRNSPILLKDKSFIQKLKKLIQRRIELDNDEIKQKVKTIDTLLATLSNQILKMMENSSLGRAKISEIKDELTALEFSKHSFETIRDRLVTIVNSIEVETQELNETMVHEESEVRALRLKVKKLELALEKAKKESKTDFLTHLVSKRGLDEELNRAEKSYERYGIDYSIAFFDLDKFKMLNDTFGHEAGDIVLQKVGEILNRIKRDVDVIGRYGGEEFLALLPNTPIKGAKTFAQKVKNAVSDFNFMYKGERLTVTISGGVANRKDYASQKEMIEDADRHLYRAKEAGRDRIFGKDD